MANTFTLKSSSYDGRYMELVCTQIPSDSNNNYSTINWTLTTTGGNVNYYSTGPTKVIINGQTVYSQSRVAWDSYKFPAKKGSVNGSLTVAHDNDGNKSISVSFSTAIKEATVGTYSGTWTLDSIPRYATVTKHNIYDKTETTVTVEWGCDTSCDAVCYSINNGEWLTPTGSLFPTYTIGGLSPNTTYKIKTRVKRKDSQLWSDSNELEVTTYNYPYCISTPEFIIGDRVTLKFYNPLKREFTFKVVANDVTLTHEWTVAGEEEYNWLGAESTQTQLYNSIPNQQYGIYEVQVTYDGHTITTDNGNTYSINPSVCMPVFSDFAYKDYTLSAVTGNDQVLIRNASGLRVTIPSDNKMVTLNGATPKYYVVSIDSQSVKVNFSNDDITVNFPAIDSVGIVRLNVRAYDSRGLSTLVYKDVTYIDYDYPVLNVDITRLNNFEEQTTLKISGTYSRVTIDGEDKNTITTLWYTYRETGGAWGNPKYLSFTASNGEYTCDNDLLMLDRDKSYEFEIWVNDSIDEGDAIFKVDVGKPIFMISSNKKTCYINGVEIPTFENMYPIGSVYCSSTTDNPSKIYGGKWACIDKGFIANYYLETKQIDTNHIRSFYLSSMRSGNSIRFYGWFYAEKNMFFEEIIYTLNLQEHGINANAFDCVQFIAVTGSQCETMKAFNLYSDGELELRGTLAAGEYVNFDFTFPVHCEGMEDDFCDKFYWQRIA